MTAILAGQEVPASALNRGGSIPGGTPASTSSSGTASSGTTETRDAVLGDFVFTAAAGRRYRVWWTGGMSGTAGERCAVRVRDGGGSTPTSSSTLLAETRHVPDATGGAGQVTIPPAVATAVLSAGTHTLSAFTIRLNGSNDFTPVFTRELYVEDMGPA